MGNIYIADFNNSRIRKVDATTSIITTVAGNGIAGYSGDNGPATSAELNLTRGVAVDGSGNIYIGDFHNNSIRKVTATTGIITTVAGNGTLGYSGDNGPATSAQLDGPDAVAVDASGNIYFADSYNNVIRKVLATTGIITTVAGNGLGAGSGTPYSGGYSGDNGSATNAELNLPLGVAVDASGNLFITDCANHRIRKVAANGIITTVAGNGFGTGSGIGGYTGDNGSATSAELNCPEGVTVDTGGNIYIADTYNSVVRKVTYH